MPPPCDVYRDELLSYGYGQAIWEPAPDDGQPAVLLGDVGYLFQGAFQRLFNIHLPRRHRFQPSTMPEYFRPLPVDDTMIKLRHLKPGAYCSTSVHAQTDDGSVATPVSLVGGEVSFGTSKQRGAILALPEHAQRVDGRTGLTYEGYIAEHCDRWLAYARHKGLNVRMEDVLLVTGCDLAKSWAVAAFVSSQVNASASLKVDLSTVGGLSASVSVQWRSMQNVVHNWGPDPSAPSFSTLMERRSTGAHDSSAAENPVPDPVWLSRTLLPGFDQCIFVRGYHMKRRRLLPNTIKAFAEHRDEQDEREDEDEGLDIASSVAGSSRSEYVVEALDGSGQSQAPSAFVHALDYILAVDPTVDLAMVHDDAVTPSLQASPIGQSVASLLSKHCPPIFPLSTQNSEMTGVLRVPLQGYSSDIESEAWSNMPSGSVFGPHETAALPRRADDVGGKTPLAERPSGKAKGKGRATSQPDYSDVTPRETLQIEKNKQMRGEGSGSRLRLSSADMRRMRRMRMSTSFENTGVIAQPHSSVEEKAFHTHIDRDLPESSRARQLLIWCAARTEAGAGHPQEPCDKLPPLDASEARLVNDVRDAAIRMLAEGLIDTNVMSPADNKRNRAKKAQYTVDIERAQAEDNAWAEVEQFYKSRHATVMSDLEQRRKTKGKQGALGPDEWGPRDAELPERFHAGVKLARSVLASAGPSSQEKSPLDKRWSDVQDTIDELHTLVNTATPTASVATADLARSFALMSLTLASHAQAHPHPHHPPAVSSASAALSAYLPPSTHEPDPQELFRALSRVDMARPPAQRGDAALRALREM